MSNTSPSRVRALFSRVVSLATIAVAIAPLLLVDVLGLTACLIFLVECAVGPVQRAWETEGWQETPCTITKSGVERREFRNGFLGVRRVEYTYSYGGHEYQGSHRSFMAEGASDHTKPRLIVSLAGIRVRYPIRPVQVCYVNPAQPSESVLYRGYEWGAIVFSFLFVSMLFYYMYRLLRSVFRRGAPRVGAQGPVELRSERTTAFYSIAANTVIFAVPTLITVLLYLDDVSPFAIGFGMFAAIVPHCLFWGSRSLWNPRLTMKVSPFPVSVGEEFEIEWKFRGSTARLRRLTVTLSGTKMERGKRSRLQTIHIFETEDPLVFAQGKALCAIPAGTRPSGENGDTRVRWRLCFRGAIPIPLWPDVREEFEVGIAPEKASA